MKIKIDVETMCMDAISDRLCEGIVKELEREDDQWCKVKELERKVDQLKKNVKVLEREWEHSQELIKNHLETLIQRDKEILKLKKKGV